MVLRWLAENVTVLNEDIVADRMQILLKGLLARLPQVLPFLYSMLETHFGAALGTARAGNTAAARAHANTVEAVLSALQAHADWAPVHMLHQHGFFDASLFLLASVEFRLPAIDFLRQVASRKKMTDDGDLFLAGMKKLLECLLQTATNVLKSPPPDGDSDEAEFLKRFVDTMAIVGTQHLRLAGEAHHCTLFLEQFLQFTRHPLLQVAGATIPCWIVLLRDQHLQLEKSSTGTRYTILI
jgi:exportin-5